MTLEELGFNDSLRAYQEEHHLSGLSVGRVIAQHKTVYILKDAQHEYEAELLGNLRFNAESRRDLPAVGDWVAFLPFDENKAIIHATFPRASIIERQAVGKFGEKQIIASNVDVGLIMQSIDRDYNINRLERYLTLCYTANIEPIVVINKIDLIDNNELQKVLAQISERLEGVTVLAISNKTKSGYDQLSKLVKKGKTHCLLGSSGVGKSSLINGLSGDSLMETGEISASADRGKHITSHRELFVLEGGAILIDNPGMREVGVTEEGSGLQITFDAIEQIASDCRFRDCKHLDEVGCAVIQALEQGDIDKAAYENYQKLQREKAHFERSIADKRKQGKAFGKMVKQMKKNKQGKY